MNTFASAAEINFVTFEHFLDEVGTLVVEHDQSFMTTYTEQFKPFGGFCFESEYNMDSATVVYQNRRIELDRFINIDARKYQLENQLSYEFKLYPDSLQELLEDVAVQSVINYGTPTLAVNIGPRQWMICDPNDFVILKSPTDIKSTLVCTHKYRNRIYNIGRK